jgi:nucleoid-associated protein YgaU
VGLFDFVKEAGAKVGIGESKAEKAAKAEAASAERAAEVAKRIKERKAAAAERKAEEVKAERKERMAELKKAHGLENYVKELGFEIEQLDVRYDDGRADVSGKVASQDIREKVILAIGNVEGVGQVSDDIEVVDPAEESDLHVVQRGDTLSAIAKEHYGDAMKYPVIFEANRPMLTDPDKIYVGQVLRIPPMED